MSANSTSPTHHTADFRDSPSAVTNPDSQIRVYNTLTKTKEPFEPIAPPKVGIYLCGPTVYAESHIGHMVGPVIFDTVKRYLRYSGYDVTWVVNITDVDDKLINKSKERGIPVSQIATEMTADYLANLRELGVNQIDFMPRATDHMSHIIRFIERLVAKDIAYEVDGDVFFDVMKDPNYGQLSNRSVDDQQGEGGDAAAKKRSAGDFALWKSAKQDEISWDSPWGPGRPGWHIECSAMSHEILGEMFDIHGGGLDLMFPHHENELAQSGCCHDKPMVKYWMHNGLMRAGEKEVRAEADAAVAGDIVIVNAAMGGRPADSWAPEDAQVWEDADALLASEGLTPDQVQVAWIKHAVRSPMFPPLDFPEHPETLEGLLVDVVRSLKANFPNVVLTYVSSRTRAYNSNQAAQSPEPAAYEGGFATQWLIERQLDGDALLRFDGVDPVAPWLSWGPYLWTDGTGAPEGQPHAPFEARSDGTVWTCADVQQDGVHPSPPTPDAADPTGEFKIGDQLMAFFLTDPTTTPWFLADPTSGPTIASLTANGIDVSGGQSISGVAPFEVSFSVSANSTFEASWTYDDGTFSYNPAGTNTGTPYFDENAAPTKVFAVPGSYDVRVALRGGGSGTTLATIPVVVTNPAIVPSLALWTRSALFALLLALGGAAAFRHSR